MRDGGYILNRLDVQPDSLQRADGGFAGRQGLSDLYYTSFALRTLAILGELHGSVAERAAGFLHNHCTDQGLSSLH